MEQEPQGSSGFVASWNPQFPPTVDTPLPPAFSPPSAPCRPPIPLSQPPSQSPDNQGAGTGWSHLHLFVTETAKTDVFVNHLLTFYLLTLGCFFLSF